jgi:hypothetical protein
MAKHIGHFPLSGRLGSVVFRRNADGSVTVANYNPVSKARIESGDEFKRTRENFAEFAGARLAAKDLRLAFPDLYANMHTRKTANRLYGVMVKTIRQGAGTRGQRNLDLSANKAALTRFEWVDSDPFTSRFQGTSSLSVLPSRDDATWTIDPFNAGNVVRVPKNATHFQFVLNITVLSDYQYSVTDSEYQPVNPGINGKTATVKSVLIPVGSNVAAPTVLNAALSGVVMASTASLIISTGIEFSQDVNGVPFTFAQNNAMVIQQVD